MTDENPTPTFTAQRKVESNDGKYLTYHDSRVMKLIETDDVFSRAALQLSSDCGTAWIMISKKNEEVFNLLLQQYTPQLMML